ncbi:MAG TPA: electron transport complex subunit E [Candidatus Syntrophosphaera sp.]|jgi:electron transport complex protein RnfE|uniref:Electron transport complex subunit E n=1 Tax=Candidatus Syntrophosphaera thermopropionivorans TaxID=2593015 RepID=A0AC61QK49_9BACT|nr:electron transport complex subunit E [Candidatus Syntrophosphaera thermopropionivorans]HRQ99348.1 electron transport complex subunit E [Candidatus Syntrophosphaera sp.]TDF73694.1 electron transport complex subunit E [Candidatus Syntrophosphaera thermopropionivorans]HOJ42204.1 electron transport complex subunit E [Candidatus Syntrophosphaera thermopropionivorans]HOL33582.1 electron transport complex subunit E [Candidatus Syntrophosphaera thermopropionivorans]HOT40075.1 electron transport com
MSFMKELTKGIVKENPIFVLVLGMCPTLATTTSVNNALGMGLAATFVLVCSNIIISMIRNIIPNKIRIPSYIIVIAAFVSIVDMVMAAYLPDLHKALGLFIPLIVVNCIIMGRAEAFASKNSVMDSMADGIGMGIGFTLALILMSSIREILGSGTWAGMKVMPVTYDPMLVAILTPGAFITLGLLMAGINMLKEKFL